MLLIFGSETGNAKCQSSISWSIAKQIVCGAEPSAKPQESLFHGMVKSGLRIELYLTGNESFMIAAKVRKKGHVRIFMITRIEKQGIISC